ncbi:MAG: conjugal transfer protein TrbL family protein [Sulfobacillus sp.]
MGEMIAGWLASIILGTANAVTQAMGQFMLAAGTLSLTLAHQPWVGQALAVTTTISGSLLGLLIAYQALTDWILWNEGTSSNHPGLFKSAFRVGAYGGLGSVLAYTTFRWGFEFATALMTAPIGKVFSVLGVMTATPMGTVFTPFLLLVFAVGALLLIVVVGIVSFQIFVRGAELVFYVVAAPIVALGWLNPDGGAWPGWFRKLIYLSLATATQWLALHGMILTAATLMLTSVTGAFTSLIAMLAWGYVALKGPHLLESWSYRSGMGQHVSTAITSRILK